MKLLLFICVVCASAWTYDAINTKSTTPTSNWRAAIPDIHMRSVPEYFLATAECDCNIHWKAEPFAGAEYTNTHGNRFVRSAEQAKHNCYIDHECVGVHLSPVAFATTDTSVQTVYRAQYYRGTGAMETVSAASITSQCWRIDRNLPISGEWGPPETPEELQAYFQTYKYVMDFSSMNYAVMQKQWVLVGHLYRFAPRATSAAIAIFPPYSGTACDIPICPESNIERNELHFGEARSFAPSSVNATGDITAATSWTNSLDTAAALVIDSWEEGIHARGACGIFTHHHTHDRHCKMRGGDLTTQLTLEQANTIASDFAVLYNATALDHGETPMQWSGALMSLMLSTVIPHYKTLVSSLDRHCICPSDYNAQSDIACEWFKPQYGCGATNCNNKGVCKVLGATTPQFVAAKALTRPSDGATLSLQQLGYTPAEFLFIRSYLPRLSETVPFSHPLGCDCDPPYDKDLFGIETTYFSSESLMCTHSQCDSVETVCEANGRGKCVYSSLEWQCLCDTESERRWGPFCEYTETYSASGVYACFEVVSFGDAAEQYESCQFGTCEPEEETTAVAGGCQCKGGYTGHLCDIPTCGAECADYGRCFYDNEAAREAGSSTCECVVAESDTSIPLAAPAGRCDVSLCVHGTLSDPEFLYLPATGAEERKEFPIARCICEDDWYGIKCEKHDCQGIDSTCFALPEMDRTLVAEEYQHVACDRESGDCQCSCVCNEATARCICPNTAIGQTMFHTRNQNTSDPASPCVPLCSNGCRDAYSTSSSGVDVSEPTLWGQMLTQNGRSTDVANYKIRFCLAPVNFPATKIPVERRASLSGHYYMSIPYAVRDFGSAGDLCGGSGNTWNSSAETCDCVMGFSGYIGLGAAQEINTTCARCASGYGPPAICNVFDKCIYPERYECSEATDDRLASCTCDPATGVASCLGFFGPSGTNLPHTSCLVDDPCLYYADFHCGHGDCLWNETIAANYSSPLCRCHRGWGPPGYCDVALPCVYAPPPCSAWHGNCLSHNVLKNGTQISWRSEAEYMDLPAIAVDEVATSFAECECDYGYTGAECDTIIAGDGFKTSSRVVEVEGSSNTTVVDVVECLPHWYGQQCSIWSPCIAAAATCNPSQGFCVPQTTEGSVPAFSCVCAEGWGPAGACVEFNPCKYTNWRLIYSRANQCTFNDQTHVTTHTDCDNGWGGKKCADFNPCFFPNSIDCGPRGTCRIAMNDTTECVCDEDWVSTPQANCTLYAPCRNVNCGSGTCFIVTDDEWSCSCWKDATLITVARVGAVSCACDHGRANSTACTPPPTALTPDTGITTAWNNLGISGTMGMYALAVVLVGFAAVWGVRKCRDGGERVTKASLKQYQRI